MSWENPDTNNKVFDGTVDLNVSNSTTSGDVSFQVKTSDSSSYNFFSNSGSVSASNGFYTLNYDKGSTSSGDFDFRVNDTDGSFTEITGVTLDSDKPSLDSNSPSGETNDDSATVEYSVSDSDAGINSSTYDLRVEDSDGNVEESADDSSLGLSSVEDGTYTAYYSVADKVGNNKSGNWDFTIDTSYDVSDPSLSWSEDESDGTITMDDDVDLTVSFDSDDEEPGSVACYDGDTDESDNKVEDATETGSDGYEYTCEFDQDDYGGETVDLRLDVCDAAGNCEQYEEGDFSFDETEPVIDDLSTPVSTVKENFDIDYDATDDIGVESLEYFYDDDSVDEGDGTSVDDVDGSFEADVSDLDSGDHTLYVRAQDTVGRWSDVSSVDFSYFPDASRTVSLSGPQRLEVTAGSSESFDIEVENTGRLLIEETDVTVSGPGASGSKTVSNMMPDDVENVSFSVSPSTSDIGEKQLTVEALNSSSSTTIALRVKANQNQQQSISSKLSDYESRLNELQSSVDSLRDKGLNSDLENRLNDNFTEFRNTVEKAGREIDAGNYYKAQSTLSNVDQKYSTAQTAYTNVKDQRALNQRNRIIVGSIAALLLIGLGGGGFYFYRSDQDVSELVDTLNLDVLKEKMGDVAGGEPEADDFEWDGFN